MHPKTREALRLLKTHKWGYLTNEETGLDPARKKGERLLVNNGTAGALVRRGLAVFVDSDDEDREADIVSIVEMPEDDET